MLLTMSAKDQLAQSTKISDLVVRSFNSSVKIALPVAHSKEIMHATRKHIPTPVKAKMWPHLESIAGKLTAFSMAITVLVH